MSTVDSMFDMVIYFNLLCLFRINISKLCKIKLYISSLTVAEGSAWDCKPDICINYSKTRQMAP